jgi:hypothetical protein
VVDRTEDQPSCSNFNWAKGADLCDYGVDGANIADDSIASHQIEIASCSGLDVELGRLFLTELSSQRDLVMSIVCRNHEFSLFLYYDTIIIQ